MKTTIIINPIAGKRNYRNIKKAINVLRSNGIIPEIRETTRRGDGEIFAQEEIKKGTEIVIAAGGDGTVNEIANGLVGSSVKLGVLPIGIANVFSLEAQIPSDPVLAINVILEGLPTIINIGHIRLRKESGEEEIKSHFLLMVGIGFDAGVVREIKRSKISKWGKAAYIFTGMRVVSKYTQSQLYFKIDQGKTIKGYSAVIGKAHYYGGRFLVTPHASLIDDSLDLCVFQSKGAWNMVKYAWGILKAKHITYTDVYYCKTKEIEVSSPNEVFIQADGDFFGRLPAYLSVKKDALTVL
ncbi:MAG: hypothetical protein AMJ42_05120 [Deltaproteobacteria bacterium DG_8]|nr:MAG: hypothetical protein AMJ42_05120 [Deltaproteobacteria bacterium DG_8]